VATAAPSIAAAPAPAARSASVPPLTESRPGIQPPLPRSPHPVRWPAIAGICLVACLVAGFAVAKRHTPATAATSTRPHPEAAVLRRYGHHAYLNGDYEMARRFYVRAVRLDPENRDAQAQQELGCALLKLGRADSTQTGQADRKGACNP
jgi:hypothetical protein